MSEVVEGTQTPEQQFADHLGDIVCVLNYVKNSYQDRAGIRTKDDEAAFAGTLRNRLGELDKLSNAMIRLFTDSNDQFKNRRQVLGYVRDIGRLMSNFRTGTERSHVAELYVTAALLELMDIRNELGGGRE